jgi:hypothetical protein
MKAVFGVVTTKYGPAFVLRAAYFAPIDKHYHCSLLKRIKESGEKKADVCCTSKSGQKCRPDWPVKTRPVEGPIAMQPDPNSL